MVPAPPPGNVTCTGNCAPQSIASLIQTLQQSMGIPMPIFFLMGFAPIGFLLVNKRAGGMTITFAFTAWAMFGLTLGFLPIWIVIFLGAILLIEAAKMFRGASFDDGPNPVPFGTMPLPHVAEEIVLPEPKTINCLNCGGPNVDRIVCEWCGKVL